MKLFFSYGHDDNEEIVNKIKENLEARGHEVWIDKASIKSGDEWRKSITDGVNSSSMTMAFASNHSIRKPGVCLDELKIAVTVKCAFVQAVILEPDINVPNIIGYRHFINMSDWSSRKNDLDYEDWYQEKLAEIIKVVESKETQEYAKDVEYLKNILKPDLSSSKKERLSKEYFCGRKWLSQKVDAWIKGEGKSNILLIDGSPGVGKSAFMANQFTFNPNVGAILFCEWDNASFNNLDALSRNLIFQLATKLTDFRSTLVDFFKNINEDEAQLALNDSFKTLLLRNIKILIDGDRPKTLILIDGIDELEANKNGSRMQNVLAELLQREADNFPAWIKFVISTRPDTRVSFPLKNVDTIHIDAYKEENKEDIRKYLNHELAEIINKQDRDKLLEKIDDNFLYARMVVNAIRDDKIELERILEGENGSLGVFYRQYLDRSFENLDEYDNIYYPIISSLAVVDEPIPKSTFVSITGWSKKEERRYIKKLSPFLAANQEHLSFYHKSFKDWLLSDEADEYIVDYDFGLKSLASGIYKSYEKDKSAMNDFELKHFITYMEASKGPNLGEVLTDGDLAKLMMKRAREKAENFAYGESVKLGHMAYKIYENINKKEQASKTALFMGDVFDAMCQLDESIKWCQKGLDVIEDEKNLADKNLPGELRLRLADAIFRKNKWKEAINQFHKAYLYYDEISNQNKKLEAMILEANTLRNATDYKKSIALFEKIEDELRNKDFQKENDGQIINYLINYAWALQENGDGLKAIECIEKVKALKEKSDEKFPNRLVAQLYYISSIVYYYQTEYERSKADALKSIDLVKKVYGENAVEKVSALNQLGSIALKEGNKDEAVKIFKEGLDIRMNYYGRENLFTSISMSNYANALQSRNKEGDINEAGKILEEVRTIREDLCSSGMGTSWLGQIYVDLADHYVLVEDYQKAKDFAQKSLEIYEANDSEVSLSKPSLILAIAAYNLGNIDESLEYVNKSLELGEETYNKNHSHLKRVRDWREKILRKIEK